MILNFRTDLALESLEANTNPTEELTKIEGIKARSWKTEVAEISDIEIINDIGAQKIGKPIGRYITIYSDDFTGFQNEVQEKLIGEIKQQINQVISSKKQKNILIAGLGNSAITPDSIGTAIVKNIIVTRHLELGTHNNTAKARVISAICPGVPGITGIESAEIIESLVQLIKPDVLLIVDALSTGSSDRLCKTVQLSDTGIVPGSGVGNAKTPLNNETLGVPVISLGVPTVIDARVLVNNFLEECGLELEELPEWSGHEPFVVTPKDIDSSIKRISKIVALAINAAMHEEFSISELERMINY